MALIQIDHVSKYYSDGTTSSKGIEDINLTFDKGEFIAITGESGSGKTTLLNVVTLMDSYDEGDILFNGKSTADFTDKEMREFRREYVSFVFQDYNLFQSLSPLKNLVIALRNRGYNHKEAVEIAKKRLEECGLKDRMKERTVKLSGGERQRVVIARALAINSPIIAFDEPTGNLDSKTSAEIMALIDKIKDNHLILFVTHDYDIVKDMATRHLVMKDGQIEQDETLRDKYLSDETEQEAEVKKPSFSSMLFSSLQIIISSPKKFLLTCLAQLLLAIAAVGISFGFIFCIDSINTQRIDAENSMYDRMVTNMPPASMLYVNEKDKNLPTDLESANIDKSAILSYIYLSLRYFDDQNTVILGDATPSLTAPEGAKLIYEGDEDESTPSYTLYYNSARMSKVEIDSDNEFFTYATDQNMSDLLNTNYQNNLSSITGDIVINGYGSFYQDYSESSDQGPLQYVVVFNESAYQLIEENADSILSQGGLVFPILAGNYSIPIQYTKNDSDFLTFQVDGIEVPYRVSDYGYSDMLPIQINKAYAGLVDKITVTVLKKTFTLRELYAGLSEIYNLDEVSFTPSDDPYSNDIFIDDYVEEQSPNNIVIYSTNITDLLAAISYKFNLISTAYYDSKDDMQADYERYRNDYTIFTADDRIQTQTDMSTYYLTYTIVVMSFLMILFIVFIGIVIALTSPTLNLILRKYNSDFGVMQTLGFSQKFLFSIRLMLIEVPLILTYVIAASIIIPIVSVNIVTSLLSYWYIFIIFSLLVILYAFLLCLNFYRREKKRSMREVLKDAGGK